MAHDQNARPTESDLRRYDIHFDEMVPITQADWDKLEKISIHNGIALRIHRLFAEWTRQSLLDGTLFLSDVPMAEAFLAWLRETSLNLEPRR